MELVEGPTLADRIAQGAIPIDEALPIAKQIAEALEAAHEQGIIHRDLKPANIKVRPDGTVKVLDFGLAKAMEPASAQRHSDAFSQSPTITTPAHTMQGAILGTAAYMSPEQARGRPVDTRTDIWAFGCVLYEMLAGRPAFARETLTDTLAAVVEGEPDWGAVPDSGPAPVLRLMRRCLDKDQKQRLRDIGEARIEIEASSNSQRLDDHGGATTSLVRSSPLALCGSDVDCGPRLHRFRVAGSIGLSRAGGPTILSYRSRDHRPGTRAWSCHFARWQVDRLHL